MGSEIKLDLTFAVPLDHTLFVEPEILGNIWEINLDSENAILEFPNQSEGDSRSLTPPATAPKDITKHLPNEHWGYKEKNQKAAHVEAFLIVIPIISTLDFNLSEEQIGGDSIMPTLKSIIKWFDSLNHWLWVLTAQSLDPIHPDPKVIHRASRNIVLSASTKKESSQPRIQPPPQKIILSRDGPSSERVANKKVMEIATSSAGTPPPLALELFASARMADRRTDQRIAIINAGTSVELALTKALGLPEDHEFTLGKLVEKAEGEGVNIPDDTYNSLVDLRNDAAHRGYISSNKKSDRALEITEEILKLAIPELIPFSSLKPIVRPKRQDLKIIVNRR